MKEQLIVIFIILNLIIVSCCNEDDSSSGAIISNIEIDLNLIPWTSLNIPDTGCIRNDSSYRELVTDSSFRNELPYVDFSKQSVLMNFKKVDGAIFSDRNVIIDSIKKMVTYTVITNTCKCIDKCKNYDHNLVIVPKIAQDYKITYR